MNLKDIGKFNEKLDEEIAWRKFDLSNIKMLITSIDEEENEKIINTYIRAGICLLYSHWEGFIKKASEYYINHISHQDNINSNLKNNFILISPNYFNKNNSIMGTKKYSTHVNFIRNIIDLSKNNYKLNYDFIIDTNSNLKSETFKDIMYLIGLEYDQYEMYFKLFDESLVERRNKIAHGEYARDKVSKEDYLQLHNKVIMILEQFKNQIFTAASKKEYFETQEE